MSPLSMPSAFAQTIFGGSNPINGKKKQWNILTVTQSQRYSTVPQIGNVIIYQSRVSLAVLKAG